MLLTSVLLPGRPLSTSCLVACAPVLAGGEDVAWIFQPPSLPPSHLVPPLLRGPSPTLRYSVFAYKGLQEASGIVAKGKWLLEGSHEGGGGGGHEKKA